MDCWGYVHLHDNRDARNVIERTKRHNFGENVSFEMKQSFWKHVGYLLKIIKQARD